MAIDKFVDGEQLTDGLESIADAIRAQLGTSGGLSFPDGFVSAIGAIHAQGKDYASGTFTVPSDATTYQINFGKTINRYLFLLEMTDQSKTDLMNTGTDHPKAFGFFGISSAREIGQKSGTSKHAHYTIPAYGGGFGTGSITINTESTYISGNALGIESDMYSVFIPGYSYNYVVVSLD